MQSSYDDTVENGAREGKKRYSRPKKREEKENIFDIWSTFSSFQGKKSKTHPNLDRDRDVSLFSLLLSWFCLWREKGTNFEETRETSSFFPTGQHRRQVTIAGLLWEQQTASAASDDDDDDEEQEDDDDDDDEEEDNTFSSSRVSSVFLFLDHFRVWRTTTIPTTTTTTTETRITER